MRKFIFVLVMVLPAAVFARWAEPADATSRINFEIQKIKIRKDGSATIRIERQVEVLKDQACDKQTVFVYVARSERRACECTRHLSLVAKFV